jgi:hypothetical protein
MRKIPFPHGGLINIPVVPYVYTKEEQEALDNAPFNADILAQLEANDKKIVRALAEGDTDRISAHMVKQSQLRAQLR